MNLLRGVVAFGEMLLEAALASTPGTQALQYLCGKSKRGHAYRVALVAADEDMFVMDPLTACRRCDRPMTEAQYEEMVAQYLMVRAQEMAEEDEAWD